MNRIASILLLAFLLPLHIVAAGENQLRISLRSEPKTLDPLLAQEESSDLLRYLTSGTLIRIDRVTQQPVPELATSWTFETNGRVVRFKLRAGVRFSNGAAFTAEDVVATFKRLFDPATQSPLGDTFRTKGGSPVVRAIDRLTVSITFPSPVAGLERLLDQVPLLSAADLKGANAVLGPYKIRSVAAGSSIILARNPHYWKRDGRGRQLPYIDTVRVDIQSNRDVELMRFQRGELDLVHAVEPQSFEQLKRSGKVKVLDLGPSFDSEMIWFNQVAASPLPAHKKRWFTSRAFRKAVSHAISRQDIVRLAYKGLAQPLAGPYSKANKIFGHPAIEPDALSPKKALSLLAGEGFQLRGGLLHDAAGNKVDFSLITNAGNKTRSRIASLVQQDLAKIGIKVSVLALDFPSLIERITKTYNYDACLLGLINVDPDPNGQMNVLLSSGVNHQWNPRQKSPATPWEAEIDKLMLAQTSTLRTEERQSMFRRVQEILAEQVPFVYLVSRNVTVGVSPRVGGLAPAALRPELLWNVERLYLKGAAAK